MIKSILIFVAMCGLTGTALGADVSNQVLYRIDVNSDPMSDGEVSESTTKPGMPLQILHPQGKGEAKGLANWGLLRAAVFLDPDFPTDQASFAQSTVSFNDVLTINGSNPGAVGSVTFRLRVIGSIRQPFYVSEVTGYAAASASLSVQSDLESAFPSGSYNAQGPEPIFAPYDETLIATVQFTVGQPITLSARLDATAETQDLTVLPNVDNFEADFYNQAALEPIAFTGVTDPAVTSESGHDYPVGTVSVTAGVAGHGDLSPPYPNPFVRGVEVSLSLLATQRVRARVFDLSGREVKVLTDRSLGAGVHPLRWDGRNEARQPARAGVYFLIVESGANRSVRRLILTR